MRAEPSVVSPNVLEAEELVGHEFNDDEDRMIAVGEMVALGAREAIMTVPDGCFASVIADGARTLYRVRMEPLEPVATVGSGDAFLAGLVSHRPLRRQAARRVPALRRGLRRGVPQRLGAGVIDARGVERVLPEVEVERLEQAAEVR